MTEGFIDSASLSELTSFTRTRRPESPYPWAFQSSMEVVMLLVAHGQHLNIAPGPGRAGLAQGPYRALCDGLAATVDLSPEPTQRVAKAALSQVRAWARLNAQKLHQKLSLSIHGRQVLSQGLRLGAPGGAAERSQRRGELLGLSHPL